MRILKAWRTRSALIVALVAALVLGVSAAAYAVVTNSTSGSDERHYIATNSDAFLVTTAPGTWQNVPGMIRTVTVPAGTTRLYVASYTAESQCEGGSWCSVRIVYFDAQGNAVEFLPASGTDYAFDSPSTDLWEGHAMDRSTNFLPAGSYRVQVQATKIGAVTTFRLDDMHLMITQIRP